MKRIHQLSSAAFLAAILMSSTLTAQAGEQTTWGTIKDKYAGESSIARMPPPKYEPLPQNLPGPEEPGGASYNNYVGGGYATLPIGMGYTADQIVNHARVMPGVTALVLAYEADGYVRRPAQDCASNEPYASLAMIVLDAPAGSPPGRQALVYVASYGYIMDNSNERAGSQIFAVVAEDSSGSLAFRQELSRLAAQVPPGGGQRHRDGA